MKGTVNAKPRLEKGVMGWGLNRVESLLLGGKAPLASQSSLSLSQLPKERGTKSSPLLNSGLQGHHASSKSSKARDELLARMWLSQLSCYACHCLSHWFVHSWWLMRTKREQKKSKPQTWFHHCTNSTSATQERKTKNIFYLLETSDIYVQALPNPALYSWWWEVQRGHSQTKHGKAIKNS